MIQELLMLIHVGVCLSLIYGCFCRAVLTDANTWQPMRLANVVLAFCIFVVLLAPILAPGWSPDIFMIIVEVGVLVARSVSSFYWRRGVPPQYQMRPVAEALDAFKNVYSGSECAPDRSIGK